MSRRTGTPEKSLVRMFGPSGQSTARQTYSVCWHNCSGERRESAVKSVLAQGKRSIKRDRGRTPRA